MEAVQYCRVIASVLWGEASVLWGIVSVLWRDSIGTAEAVQYSAVLNSLHSSEPTLYRVIKLHVNSGHAVFHKIN